MRASSARAVALLGPQRDDGVDARRAPCRSGAGRYDHHSETRSGYGERDGIAWCHAEDKPAENSRAGRRRDEAYGAADRSEPRGLAPRASSACPVSA